VLRDKGKFRAAFVLSTARAIINKAGSPERLDGLGFGYWVLGFGHKVGMDPLAWGGPAPHGPQNNVEIKSKTISTKPTTVTETASG